MSAAAQDEPLLDVWLYGTRIAWLGRGIDERPTLRWTTEATERWGEGARLLSAKLPIGTTPVPPLVRNYLDGLLPEGNARTNYALAAGVPPDDSLGLIRAYGRDTSGAAIFVEAGAKDPSEDGHYESLTIAEVATRLNEVDRYSPARFDEFTGESSTLPGMVPKIALHRVSGQWFACKDGAPSTWILKRGFPGDSDVADVIDTEAACLDLARRLGLTTIEAEVLDLGDLRAIAVSRYDRRPNNPEPRIHQEDLAQAIGLDTRDPNRKFQYGARMPSLRLAADVLRRDGGNPDSILRLATFSVLVGNTDLHAKNISFLRRSDGGASIAPAYDVAMHLHHPREGRRFAMDVNGKYWVDDVRVADLIAEGVAWGLPVPRAESVVGRVCADLAGALTSIDRSLHPGVPSRAWEVVDARVAKAGLAIGGEVSLGREPKRRRPTGPRRPR